MLWTICLVFFVGVFVGFWIREIWIGRDIERMLPVLPDGKVNMAGIYAHPSQFMGPEEKSRIFEAGTLPSNCETGYPDTEPPHTENEL